MDAPDGALIEVMISSTDSPAHTAQVRAALRRFYATVFSVEKRSAVTVGMSGVAYEGTTRGVHAPEYAIEFVQGPVLARLSVAGTSDAAISAADRALVLKAARLQDAALR